MYYLHRLLKMLRKIMKFSSRKTFDEIRNNSIASYEYINMNRIITSTLFICTLQCIQVHCIYIYILHDMYSYDLFRFIQIYLIYIYHQI